MIPRHLTLRLLTLMAAAGSTNCLVAQTAEPAATPAPAASEEVVTLDTLEVSDVPIEQNIMPTSRPFNSVYGTDKNITEIPRNVTIISREQLSAIAIKDVRDFSKLTSSSFTRTNFGAPGNPDIRGQYADIFVNGIRERITSNGNGMPIDFNSVESVNIVKGPATPIQGTSAYVGGFVDLITKRPTFDQQKTVVSATIGSYDVYRWTADYNAPVSEELAVRFSYAGEDSKGYYESEYSKTQSLYGAATWKPNDKYELFVNATAAYMEYTENWGYNRPTQALIDDGLYVTGTNVNGGTSASPSDPQNAGGVQGAANVIAYGPTVSIDQHTRLLKNGDNSLGRNFKVQAIQTVEANPDLRVVNNNLFTYTRRSTYSSYYYNEVVDPSITLESRFEFQKSFDDASINVGAATRYIAVEAYNDFFFEPANVWDLSQPSTGIDVTKSTAFQNSIGTARVPVPGYNGYYAADTGDTNDSSSISFGPFVQGDYKLTDKLTLLAGGRLDFLKVESDTPLFNSASAEESVVLPNVNTSATYKVTPKTTAYVTYNYSQNTAGAIANGGGYSAAAVNENSLTQPSTLYEGGFKWALLNNKLFIGTAVFDQVRYVKPLNSTAVPYHYQGFEIEVNYQPNKNFYATAGYSAIDGEAGSSGFEAIMLEFSRLPGQQQASGGGAFNFTEVGNIRVQGLPKHQFNALAAYKFDNGFGGSLSGTLHSEINNNWAGTIVIPWQFNIDASVFYATKNWEARISILNATDELNFAPPNGVYGNESILIEEGIRGEFTLTYKF